MCKLCAEYKCAVFIFPHVLWSILDSSCEKCLFWLEAKFLGPWYFWLCFMNNNLANGLEQFQWCIHQNISEHRRRGSEWNGAKISLRVERRSTDLRWFNTVFLGRYLTFWIGNETVFPNSDGCEIFTRYFSCIELCYNVSLKIIDISMPTINRKPRNQLTLNFTQIRFEG